MANPATLADVESRWRPLTPAEQITARTLLSDAWWMVLGRLPNLEANLADETVSEGNARRVLANMVIRVMRNPEGLLEESVDDYRYRRDSLVSSGALHITSDELADLSPGRRSRRSVRLVAYGEV